jgi:hypothetical protein
MNTGFLKIQPPSVIHNYGTLGCFVLRDLGAVQINKKQLTPSSVAAANEKVLN